jgi:hypothetical protein
MTWVGRTLSFAAAVVLAGGMLSGAASAHLERPTEFPDGSGRVPRYRPMVAEPSLVVCQRNSGRLIAKVSDRKLRRINQELLKRCDFRNVQDAVDAVKRKGTTIYVLPGAYKENPYRKTPKCAEAVGQPPLSYVEQYGCRHAENLIGVFGDDKPTDDKRECNAAVCNLQIEGTGDDPEDVVITGGFNKKGQWAKLNGIRGDRSDGLYLKNFTIELFEFNAIYILETDGFVIDEVVSRYNDEYGYLTYAVDHGVHKDCEAHHNGEAAVYPGSASDLNGKSEETGPLEDIAVVIKRCKFHHSVLGMAGTAGNSLHVYDNDVYKNSTGLSVDSFFPNHPGLPQNHSWLENNRVYSNNENYFEKYVYSGKCDKKPAKRGYEKGTICPIVPVPVGTGVLIAGGSHNYLNDNFVWDNWRAGMMMFGVPAFFREDYDPASQFDTSNHNMFVNNYMGMGPQGQEMPNGTDFWWDDQGEGNCWTKNESAEDQVTSNTMYPGGLPDCESGGSESIPLNPYKQVPLIPCGTYDREDPVLRQPPGCTWMASPEKPS